MGAGFSQRVGLLLSPQIVEDRNEIPIHQKCRNCGQICHPNLCSTRCVYAVFTRTGRDGIPEIIRPVVPDDKVRWNTPFGYNPIEFTSKKVLQSKQAYVDKDPRLDSTVSIHWNAQDKGYNRRSYHGNYRIVDKLPQNPCGRTGVTGRGHLGHFGPNHAADPIVTRWKRDEHGHQIIHPKSRKPILQFVSVERRDTKERAIPGGMVDLEEEFSETLQREFIEETLGLTRFDSERRNELVERVKRFFANDRVKIYCGYVDDPRNTDNAWMETTAFNFHDGENRYLGQFEFEAGDDACSVAWVDIDSQTRFFASHADFLRRVASLRDAHW